jgi:hypothetical protein
VSTIYFFLFQYGGKDGSEDEGENEGGAGGENGGVPGQDGDEDAGGNREDIEVIPMFVLNVDPNGGNDVGDDANINRQPPPNDDGQFLCKFISDLLILYKL